MSPQERDRKFAEEFNRRQDETMFDFLFGNPDKVAQKSKKSRMIYLSNEFDGLDNDIERWQWIRDHQDDGITVMLDNSDTFGFYDDDEKGFIFQFDDYIGWGDGVQSLLRAMGIKAESV